MNKKEEVKAINIQLVALIIVVLSTIISILITYNQKLDLEDRKTLFDSKESFDITLFNRILIVVLSFIFLYVNIKLFILSIIEEEDLKSYILQIIG